MKVRILLLLAALLLSACNVVVSTSEEPELTVAVHTLPGRWHHVEKDGILNTDEYVDALSQTATKELNLGAERLAPLCQSDYCAQVLRLVQVSHIGRYQGGVILQCHGVV